LGRTLRDNECAQTRDHSFLITKQQFTDYGSYIHGIQFGNFCYNSSNLIKYPG
jgi:hypothetical protein